MFAKFQGKRIERNQVISSTLLFNTLSWYILGQSIVTKMRDAFGEGGQESLVLGLIYAVFLIVSAIFSSAFLIKSRRKHLFSAWVIFGILTSISSAISVDSSLFVNIVIISLLGVSTGIGLPSCLSYFAESISHENRGKAGGIIFFVTFFSAAVALVLILNLDFLIGAAILAFWRVWALPLLFFVSEKSLPSDKTSQIIPSLISILRDRNFVLYFVAWLMFAFVNSFEGVVVDRTIGEYRFFIKIVEPAVASFSALAAGILSDWVGRKRVLIFGFVSLGMAYAVIGLLAQSWVSWLFYFVMDGIAIGSLWVLFVIVLWGDLSRDGSEKFYAIGGAPFFLTELFSLVLAPYLSLIPESSAFSLAAFFLFLAVLPLLYARETLPEKKIKERELKLYIEKAKKVKEKYT
jgi:MFS family permease